MQEDALAHLERRLEVLEEYVNGLKCEDLRIASELLESFGPDALSEGQRRILLDSGSGLLTPPLVSGSECPEERR